jgi:hypothetical protein
MIVGTLKQDRVPEAITHTQVYANGRVHVCQHFLYFRIDDNFFHKLVCLPELLKYGLNFVRSTLLDHDTKAASFLFTGHKKTPILSGL